MKNKKQDNKYYVAFGALVYLVLCLASCHITIVRGLHPNYGFAKAIESGLARMSETPLAIFPLTGDMFKMIGLVSILFVFIVVWFCVENQRNSHSMPGKESGSSHWNTDFKKYNKQFTDPAGVPTNTGPNNMILSKNVFLNMDTKKTLRNNNVCVVGGSGSGKSRFLVKPNILQANCNYVVTDPAGDLLESTGGLLEKEGYEIKVFNLVEMAKSDCYNPFNYIRDDLGVLMMINCLIKNTNPDGKSASDPFWEKSETALLQALCFYLIKYRPKSDQNFSKVMELLRAAEINEQNPNAKSPLDRIFEKVERDDPTSIALKQYRTFKMGAGKTLKSILISCSVRLTVFNLNQIENLTGRDTIDLGHLGDDKKALFVIIPVADSTYNFLVSMLYSQLFETLYFVAETQKKSKKLDRQVRFLLDEFVNIGTIPEFTKKLSTMRKYEISCTIILQNLAQLKTMYKDDWETIMGNCDSFIFLGGQEYSTMEYISKELGDTTIVVRDNSRSRGKSSSSSLSYRHSGRKLLLPEEVGRLDNSQCIILIRGLFPFKDDKYDYPKHPQYQYTGDANYEYRYKNNKNNSIIETETETEQKVAEHKTLGYIKANENLTPSSRIISDIKSNTGLIKTLGLTNSEEIFSRFVVIEPKRTVSLNEYPAVKAPEVIQPVVEESVPQKPELVKQEDVKKPEPQDILKENYDPTAQIPKLEDVIKENEVTEPEVETVDVNAEKYIRAVENTANQKLPTVTITSSASDEADEWNFETV